MAGSDSSFPCHRFHVYNLATLQPCNLATNPIINQSTNHCTLDQSSVMSATARISDTILV
ncbi:hypothetical protein BAQU_0665 [Bifidobacterium aquikefiri]|uniref:Uncharacterized protein n=1 Tax=Bifidobacterium aquikefiri TaxID=1653207 RepID=A0A261G8P2_9BIFI|nr:hypothetical protein BAQU_0665 [Bifidobacterium aquikefiri]